MVKTQLRAHLSLISQIIFVEKKLSCGEISAFYTEFDQFMEFYEVYAVFVPNLCGEKSVRRKSVWIKNDKYEVCPPAPPSFIKRSQDNFLANQAKKLVRS